MPGVLLKLHIDYGYGGVPTLPDRCLDRAEEEASVSFMRVIIITLEIVSVRHQSGKCHRSVTSVPPQMSGINCSLVVHP